jgi:phage shock protein A
MTENVKELQTLVIVLLKKVAELTQEVADLKARLAKYETPKNSNNSSVPPSKEENRPNRESLRERSETEQKERRLLTILEIYVYS